MTELSAEDRGLLELLLEEEGVELFRCIPRRKDSAPAPLSFAQQRLWFLQNLEPASPAYNLPRAFALRGPLDVEMLGRSLSEVVERHEVLRTTFETAGGEPVQVVGPARPLRVGVTDLRGLPEDERERRVRAAAEEEARRPFDLGRGPLLRASLLRLADDEHVLLFTMHHIVCDEWSTAILIGEVGALYEAFSKGEPSPLEELPVQYADYAAWQREWLSGRELGRQLDYWKARLAGELPPLELPIDRPRPAAQTYNGASTSLALGQRLSESLRDFSRREGATLFITLYAAFAALLYRYAGQPDVLVGSPIAGRGRAEVEGLIGFFVNTLVMRADLSGDPDFRTLLGRAREVAFGAYEHQDLPFELLVQELQPERSLSHTPLFQVVFALRAARRGETAAAAAPAAALEVSPLHFGNESAKFDLFLSAEDTGRDLRAHLIYNTDLFDGATASRMLSHYRRLLEAAVADPTCPVSALPLLTEEERRLLLVEWNRTGSGYPRDSGIHREFELQAERRPDAVAVAFRDEKVTYAELNRRANRLARRLRELGVGPDDVVGICLERSVEMVVGLLAILKAGGAYLPLDAEYPERRLSYLIEDSGARVILADARAAGRLPGGAARVVCVEREELTHMEGTNLDAGAGADGLAYVIYTSGSTGEPKGVAVPHRAVLRLVCRPNFIRLDETECLMQLAPVSFDASTLELWGPLLHGGRCALYPERRPTPRELGEAIRAYGVTTMWLTASLYNAVIDEAPEELSGLRQLLVGGEALSAAHVAKGLRELPRTQLVNGYGPTEATTFTCCYPVPRDEEWPRASVPVGRPISDTRVYVLDAGMGLVPLGVAGELYVAGDGLARGYLRRPALTAERFVPDPFSEEPGARLYRTGDLARFLPDGRVEFISRADTQVKVRGFRIELGEIEAALREHESVQEAAVLAREDEPGDKRLVAYVVGAPPARHAVEQLRAHLRERLPDYMAPGAFVFLDALPLTANGKVDRKRLPAPAAARAEQGADFAAPRTPVEEIVAAVWRDVLGVGRVGAREDFFALGGHSLMASRVVTLLRASFGVDLPLRAIFENPTVAGLAEFIEASLRADEEPAPPLVRARREGNPPLSFAQQSLWLDDQLVPGGNTAYNIQTAVRLDGRLDADALADALAEVVRRHESLRTTFACENWGPVQVIAPAAGAPVHVRDLTALPEGGREAEALRLTTAEAREPFDLSKGPLLRATLYRLGEERHLLALVIHHIISDAWSIGVLVREVGALYGAFSKGEPSPLAELPVQYADYAVWQRRWMRGEVLERHLAYWTRQLEGLPELRLPTDRPRPAVQSFRGAHLHFTLGAELAERLRALGRERGATVYMVMLAAYKALMHYYAGAEDVVVGTNVANRGRAEVEGLIGYFVNTLMLRTDLSGDPTFAELLGRVREVTLAAYARQELPFDKLVEALRPRRDQSRSALFQVFFGLNSAPPERPPMSGLTIGGVEIEKGTSIYDLSFFFTDAGRELVCLLRYSIDLFDEATVERMWRQFELLLGRVVSDPQARLSDLRGALAEAEAGRRQAAVADLKKLRKQVFKTTRRRAVTEEG